MMLKNCPVDLFLIDLQIAPPYLHVCDVHDDDGNDDDDDGLPHVAEHGWGRDEPGAGHHSWHEAGRGGGP
jgi:hypothetical protein